MSGSVTTPPNRTPWLFSPAVDLCAFLGSAVIALSMLVVGSYFGWLNSDTPEWMWVIAILMVDVAHVYSTGFRVYFDRVELKRRPWLYGLTPLLAFAIGLAVYSESPTIFWRILAYLAVFHFIRQQYGWVALYRSRAGDQGRLGWWIDSTAIYLATLYPLVHWHGNLPRRFYWFLSGDFGSLPTSIVHLMEPIYWGALVAYAVRALYRTLKLHQPNYGKDIVLVTTVVCWYVGIISFNSDYAFTVTNVIIHGVPYMVLIYWYGSKDQTTSSKGHVQRIATFLGIVWMLAYLEELLWDCGVWHEREWFFGMAWELGGFQMILVPLLTVPQITHYVLDGFIWRRSNNQHFSTMVNSVP